MGKEILVNFNQDMVKAILSGDKTQTRRPLWPQPFQDKEGNWCVNRRGVTSSLHYENVETGEIVRCDFDEFMKRYYKPRFQPGDIMCVRERARLIKYTDKRIFSENDPAIFRYEVDQTETELKVWPDRIKMFSPGQCVPNGCFKELVRIKRKVVRVWYERVQDITVRGCEREGIYREFDETGALWYGVNKNSASLTKNPFVPFIITWNSIYPGSWDRNDWVECTEFEGVDYDN